MDSTSMAACEARARVFKALGHPTRLYLVTRLAERESCVCDLADGINANFSTVSRHLSVLKDAGVVEDEKRGMHVYYRLRVTCILEIISCIDKVVEMSIREKETFLREQRKEAREEIGQADSAQLPAAGGVREHGVLP